LITYTQAQNICSGHPLIGLIDTEKIGVTGHSLGGYTTLMVGGVPFHCEDFKPAAGECDSANVANQRAADPCCRKIGRAGDPFAARDERVDAMLPLGPAVLFPDFERAASEVEIPVMIISGGHRMEVPWEPIQAFYDNAPAPKYAVRLKKTDHMTVSDMTLAASPIVKPVLPGFRFGYKQKAQAYKDYSVAFFDLYLKGDDSRAAVLNGPTNKFVEFQGEAQ
jgi:predicted dienelactone hydrolase